MKLVSVRIVVLGLCAGLLVGCDSSDDSDVPAVTADMVTDSETLKTFVEEARRIYVGMLNDQPTAQVNAAFREEGGYWKHEDIYVFILNYEGTNLLHAGNPSLEGEDLWDLEDIDGLKIVQKLITVAQSGGGYLEYFFDNPAIEGDEETGSPKLSYVLEIVAPALNDGAPALIGSGVYL